MEAAKQNKVGTDLTSGPLFKALLIFVVPIVISNLIQQLYTMVDLMVVGRYVGAAGTVAVSTGGEISDFATPVAAAFSTAGQIYVAQLAGAKLEKKLHEAIGTFLSLLMAMSLAATVIVILLAKPILTLLNCPTEAFLQARVYMIITCLGIPFIFGYNAVCGLLRGMGESKKPLLFITIAAAVNIVLDLVAVAWLGLGAAGTAIATTLSQVASCAAAFTYMYRNREAFDFEMEPAYFRIRLEHARVILGLGIPQAARSTLVRFSMLWVNAGINSYGLIYSATNGVGNKLQKFLEIFSQSMSQAGAAMIGQNLGAKQYDRAKKVVYYSCASTVLAAALISLAVIITPRGIFGIFTNDPEVLDLGVIYLHIMIVHFFMSAVTSSFQSMVIGAGQASLNFVIGMLDGVVCKIGLSLIFANLLGMGAIGYFWGTALSRVLPGIICIAFVMSGRWKKSKLIQD